MELRRIFLAFFILTAALSLTACSLSVSDIEQTVFESMQESFDQDPDFQEFDLNVQSVKALKINGNSYKGVVDLTYDGNKEQQITVDILVDGDYVMWEAKDGAFIFLMEPMLEKLNEELESLDWGDF